MLAVAGQMKRQPRAPFPIPLRFISQQFIKQLKFSYYALFYAVIFLSRVKLLHQIIA